MNEDSRGEIEVPWAKFSDGFDDDPELHMMGPEAGILFVCAVTWCSRNLTDGYIPDVSLRRLVGYSTEAVERLTTAQMPGSESWLTREGQGYRVRSYLEYNPSKEQVEQAREALRIARSEAGKKGMASRWGDNKDNKPDNKPITKAVTNAYQKNNPVPVPIPIPDPISPTPSPERAQVSPKSAPASPEGGKGSESSRRPDGKTWGAADCFDLLPETHQTPEMRDALESYDRYRKAKRIKCWVEATVASQARHMAQFPPEATVAAIRQAIECGWQGFFPEKHAAKRKTHLSWADVPAVAI